MCTAVQHATNYCSAETS